MAEPVLAMWKKGTETHRSPLFVEDLTSGIMAALDDPATQGQIIEAMGPDKFLQGDLLNWMHEVMHKDPVDYRYKMVDLRFSPFTIGKAIAASLIPYGFGLKYFRAPTLEKLERSQLTEMSEGYPDLTDLGVKLHTVQEKMVWELEFYRAFQWHEYRSEEEKPKIYPLLPLTAVDVKKIEAKAAEAKNIIKAIGIS